MVDGLGVRDPQAIFLGTRTKVFGQRGRIQRAGVFSAGVDTYPKWTVPTNDIPEILEEPLLWSSSFFRHEIPLVSLGISSSALWIHRRERKGTDRPSGGVPKIQDGFAGPGTFLIAEGFLCLRRKTYTKIAVQVVSAPS